MVEVIMNALSITVFVMVMMLLIEFINVRSKGTWSKPFSRNKWMQIIFAAFMGVIPGCLGAYTVVSLYTHNVINFAALVTAMIATFGDEAFILFSVNPEIGILLTVLIFTIAIVTGFILNLFKINGNFKLKNQHFEIHEDKDCCKPVSRGDVIKQLKNISWQRAVLMISLIVFIIGLFMGEFSHNHSGLHFTDDGSVHDHGHDHGAEGWDWVRVTFLLISGLALFIVTVVTNKFIKEHLWNHIIKKHFLKIFLWTFGALALIFLLDYFGLIEVKGWINDNKLFILLIAIIIGIIPASGMHNIVFIGLYFSGTIGFSVLLANSIVQDGHGSLPLFAESKKSFFKMKLINVVVGLIVGLTGYFMGW